MFTSNVFNGNVTIYNDKNSSKEPNSVELNWVEQYIEYANTTLVEQSNCQSKECSKILSIGQRMKQRARDIKSILCEIKKLSEDSLFPNLVRTLDNQTSKKKIMFQMDQNLKRVKVLSAQAVTIVNPDDIEIASELEMPGRLQKLSFEISDIVRRNTVGSEPEQLMDLLESRIGWIDCSHRVTRG